MLLYYILYNIVFKHKLNFKLKTDQKIGTYENLEKIGKPRNIFEKMSGNPVV